LEREADHHGGDNEGPDQRLLCPVVHLEGIGWDSAPSLIVDKALYAVCAEAVCVQQNDGNL
jgi:hypothetical protein